MKYTLLTLAAALLLAGCDLYSQDDFSPEYVVESYLIAGTPLAEVKLSRTAPVEASYAFEERAVRDAEVVVRLLDESGGIAESYPYVAARPGIYRPAGEPVTHPDRTYELHVRVPADGSVLRARTHVPASFQIVATNTDTVGYQSAEQWEARITRSTYPTRQNVYAFLLVALDTVNYGLTPMYAGLIDHDHATKSSLARNYGGLVNESTFDVDAQGYLRLRLPWVAVAFYGPNDIVAAAVDDNLYDFMRSLDRISPTPGQIENLIANVEGGRGIFGSMAEARVRIFVRPPGN